MGKARNCQLRKVNAIQEQRIAQLTEFAAQINGSDFAWDRLVNARERQLKTATARGER